MPTRLIGQSKTRGSSTRSRAVNNRLNETMKRLTVISAIFAALTVIAGIYGMNFQHMPELGWFLGYPFALLLMVASSVALWVVFKKSGWL